LTPDLATALIMGVVIQPASFKTSGRAARADGAARLAAACWSVLQA